MCNEEHSDTLALSGMQCEKDWCKSSVEKINKWNTGHLSKYLRVVVASSDGVSCDMGKPRQGFFPANAWNVRKDNADVLTA